LAEMFKSCGTQCSALSCCCQARGRTLLCCSWWCDYGDDDDDDVYYLCLPTCIGGECSSKYSVHDAEADQLRGGRWNQRHARTWRYFTVSTTVTARVRFTLLHC